MFKTTWHPKSSVDEQRASPAPLVVNLGRQANREIISSALQCLADETKLIFRASNEFLSQRIIDSEPVSLRAANLL
jgi:hypothetical protein